MSDFVFDPHSSRAGKARVAQLLGKTSVRATLTGISVVFSILAIAVLVSGSSIGWLLGLPAIPTLLCLLWYAGDLKRLTTGRYIQGNRVLLDQALEPATVARLGERDAFSAYDIWKAIENSEDHIFLHNRYGVDASYFETFVSKDSGSDNLVWDQAQRLQQKYGTDGFTNMVVLLALIHSAPNAEQLMRSAGLELGDIETAIDWMRDIKVKRAYAQSKRNYGGIGRDWAYGYTPLLRNLGHNISEGIQMHGFFSDTSMHEQVVRQMSQALGTSNATITLVGEEGVGKTTCVYALADALLTDPSIPKKITHHQIVQLDASTLVAHAQRQGQLEQLVIRIINEAHHAKNIILFFDEAQMFFGGSAGSVDLTNVLQPVIESGSVRIVLAMNPHHWQRLSSSGLASRLTPITVTPSNQHDTTVVLRDEVLVVEYRHKVIFTYQALQEAYKLGNRYVTTQAMPGAALVLLSQTAANAQSKLITRDEIQRAVEQIYGIKLQTASATETDNLLHLEDDLRKQVISQDRAISVVANALRRARSGVGNPDRPIGTFLFLGPTGVGKTELSKAVARSYFGDEKALIRVDMNQYVAANDVARLTAPHADGELSFLGRVRKQPFSVILLDEIEKAHPAVVNSLLQLLDEGVMRDSENRSVSFRDAIIIATSNAGADEIRKLIDDGKKIDELENTFVDTLIAKGSFAPEFINRFDEVVLFSPLAQNELTEVVDIIVTGINKTLDSQKVTVTLTQDAKEWLVAKGYDSKLGARPMRRMVQRYVENIVAKRLLEHSLQSGGDLVLSAADFESSK